MNRYSKTLIAALGALAFTAVPAAANAERVFFLVGTRHVYRIGTSEYENVEARQKIEQDYADQVAADQEQFNKAVADGADAHAEGQNLNAALDDLAEERDKELGALYEQVDWERESHPELQIEGDGPYQVMGINFHMRGAVQVFESFNVFAPWPGYEVVERPYGWEYGVAYTPAEFHQVYAGWYGSYVEAGRPVFIGIYGHEGPVRYEIHGGSGYRFERRHIAHREGFERSPYFRGHGPLGERKVERIHNGTRGHESTSADRGSRYSNHKNVSSSNVSGNHLLSHDSTSDKNHDRLRTSESKTSDASHSRYTSKQSQASDTRTTAASRNNDRIVAPASEHNAPIYSHESKVKTHEEKTTTYNRGAQKSTREEPASTYNRGAQKSTRGETTPSYNRQPVNTLRERETNRPSPTNPVRTPSTNQTQRIPSAPQHVSAPIVPRTPPVHIAPPARHRKG